MAWVQKQVHGNHKLRHTEILLCVIVCSGSSDDRVALQQSIEIIRLVSCRGSRTIITTKRVADESALRLRHELSDF